MVIFSLLLNLVFFFIVSSFVSLIYKNMNDIEIAEEEQRANTDSMSFLGGLIRLIKILTRKCWQGQTENGQLQAYKIGGIVAGISFLNGFIRSIYLFWLAWPFTVVLIWVYYRMCKNSLDESRGVGEIQEIIPYVVLSWLVYIPLGATVAISFLPWWNNITATIASVVSVVPAIVGTVCPIVSFLQTQRVLARAREEYSRRNKK